MCGRGCAGGGVCGGGACVVGGVRGRGMHGRGMHGRRACMAVVACVAGGGMHGSGGMCDWGHLPWKILQDMVNEWAVRILLECILVYLHSFMGGNQSRWFSM